MNAFMIFGNEQRIRIKTDNPSISNKDVSVKLGEMWSAMSNEEKQIYFKRSKDLEREHKSLYPDYKYLPGITKLAKTLKKRKHMDRQMFVEKYKNSTAGPENMQAPRYRFPNPSNTPTFQFPTTPVYPRMRYDYPYSANVSNQLRYFPSPFFPSASVLGQPPLPRSPSTRDQEGASSCSHDGIPENPMQPNMYSECSVPPGCPSFVMVPVDAKFAQMLGWPLHMLQPVTPWMQDSFSMPLGPNSYYGTNDGHKEDDRSVVDGATDSDIETESLPDLGSQQLFRGDIEDNESIIYQPESPGYAPESSSSDHHYSPCNSDSAVLILSDSSSSSVPEDGRMSSECQQSTMEPSVSADQEHTRLTQTDFSVISIAPIFITDI